MYFNYMYTTPSAVCLCDNIGLVSLILLGWELRVSYITVLCVQGIPILSPLPSLYSLYIDRGHVEFDRWGSLTLAPIIATCSCHNPWPCGHAHRTSQEQAPRHRKETTRGSLPCLCRRAFQVCISRMGGLTRYC